MGVRGRVLHHADSELSIESFSLQKMFFVKTPPSPKQGFCSSIKHHNLRGKRADVFLMVINGPRRTYTLAPCVVFLRMETRSRRPP